MLCEKCKIREANVFYTEIIDGDQKNEHHLCSQCAKDLDQYTAVANEEELLLGINTDKKKANGFEDYYNGVNIPLKKVSGSDIAPDDFENSFLNKKDY